MAPVVQGAVIITSVKPDRGSLAGGTRVHIQVHNLQCLLLILCVLPYVLCAAEQQSKSIALARTVNKSFGKRNAFFW